MRMFFESGDAAAIVVGALLMGVIYVVWVMHYNR